ncbi:MAG: Holliday junction branch migration protein RuvA [Dehalococcoidia bacterium]
MISRIQGKAMRWNADNQSVEVEVSGFWYEVLLPTYCWRALEAQPESVHLYTYYYVPERNPTPVLIGFLRPVEREFFKKFLKVRGMGPTKAQRALATSVSTIAHWIETEDKAALRQLPGVGTRQADQIVAELKGKVVEEALLRDEHYTQPPVETAPALDKALADAVDVLVNLGYQRREAQQWVEQVVSEELEPDPEAVLRAVFQHLAANG